MPKKKVKCQDCGNEIEFEVTSSQPQQETIEIPNVAVSTAQPQQVLLPPSQTASIPEPKKEESKDPHEEMTKALPSGVNFAKCEGADCGHVKLKNPKQTTKYKACPSCKANTVPKNNDFCPNCGIEEESKKFQEWEDSDIETEEEEEDE